MGCLVWGLECGARVLGYVGGFCLLVRFAFCDAFGLLDADLVFSDTKCRIGVAVRR